MVSVLMFKSLSHFELAFTYGVSEGGPISFFFFCLWISVILIQFVEETILSPLCILGTLVKDQLTVYVWVYFWALHSVPLVYKPVFMPVTYCFNYYSVI